MSRRDGFTLVELIVVIAIIGLLSSLLLPQVGKFQSRAQSVVCMNNLRQIGVGVLSYVGDNNYEYPVIEPNAQNPVYPPTTGDDPTEVEAKPMLDVLGPYGVTDSVLKCPTDLKGLNWYAKSDPHTSYQWRVMLDSENANAAKIYGGRRGYGVRIVKPSRVTICTDYERIHSGKMNSLYADGHVSKPN
ncbi:MAG: prepilin-type N-terminal cleavage/methylation domain-containing protein [Verrucomicrobiae bacterium]